MRYLLIALSLLISGNILYAQEPTKEEAITALKDMLKGQMIHYHYGGPCTNNTNSSWTSANSVTIGNIKMDYDMLQIEYTYERDGKIMENIKRVGMNNYFVVKENAILESNQQTVDWNCEGVIAIAIPFEDDAKASQEKTLKLLNSLKRFVTKPTFD